MSKKAIAAAIEYGTFPDRDDWINATVELAVDRLKAQSTADLTPEDQIVAGVRAVVEAFAATLPALTHQDTVMPQINRVKLAGYVL